jgi:uncharacterized protein YprB with RNaseH-like and TPR domain
MFLDIESGGSLDANWGMVLTYAWCDLTHKKAVVHKIHPREILQPNKYHRDKRLVELFCEEVKPYDIICVYYGKDSGIRQRHDIPFLRTRAFKHKIGTFPKPHSKKVIDVYDIIRGKLKLSRNRMMDACDHLDIPSKGHPMKPDIWLGSLAGDPKCIDYIAKHNVEDVYSLRALWMETSDYARKGNL